MALGYPWHKVILTDEAHGNQKYSAFEVDMSRFKEIDRNTLCLRSLLPGTRIHSRERKGLRGNSLATQSWLMQNAEVIPCLCWAARRLDPNATKRASFLSFHHERIPTGADGPIAMEDRTRLKVIEDYPIGNGLDAFRTSFRSICEGRSIS